MAFHPDREELETRYDGPWPAAAAGALRYGSAAAAGRARLMAASRVFDGLARDAVAAGAGARMTGQASRARTDLDAYRQAGLAALEAARRLPA